MEPTCPECDDTGIVTDTIPDPISSGPGRTVEIEVFCFCPIGEHKERDHEADADRHG